MEEADRAPSPTPPAPTPTPTPADPSSTTSTPPTSTSDPTSTSTSTSNPNPNPNPNPQTTSSTPSSPTSPPPEDTAAVEAEARPNIPLSENAEVWVRVFGYLSVSDMSSVVLVCSDFAEIARANSTALWRAQLLRRPWRAPLPRKSSRSLREYYRWKASETARNWREGRANFSCLWGHTGFVVSLHFDENVLATGSTDQTIKIWDIHGTRKELATLTGHESIVYQVELQKNGLLASCASKSVRMWDIETGINTISAPTAHAAYDLKTNGWGELMVAHHDGSFRHLDFRVPGFEVSRSVQHKEAAVCLVWDLDRYVITGSVDKTCKVHDRRMNGTVASFAKHRKAVTSIAWEGPGSAVVTGSLDKTVRLWNAQTGKAIRKLAGNQGHTESVTAVMVHGRRLVTGSNDRTLRLWSTKGRLIQTWGGFSGDVFSLQFSQNLMVCGSVRTANVWDFEALER